MSSTQTGEGEPSTPPAPQDLDTRPTAGRDSAPDPAAQPDRPARWRAPARPEGLGAAPRRLTVLSGPSGVGKSTVVAHLRTAHPEIWHSVSVTTRHARPGEIHGVHYFFTDQQGFDKLVANSELLEWAQFAGNRYGTPRQPVLDRLAAGMPTLLEIDLQGARQVRAAMPEALQVFLAPPSWDELVRRLTRRGTEPPEVVERRLAAARVELAAESEFDVTLVNTSVQDVARELVNLMGLS
ncbi:MAG TPA: guanylate kinase [Actinocrinis sp.]|nr:guanylate kinase [Actinocrinis sp.]